jgi:hypothetical protein
MPHKDVQVVSLCIFVYIRYHCSEPMNYSFCFLLKPMNHIGFQLKMVKDLASK